MTESLASYKSSINDYEKVANDYRIVEFINGDIIVTPPPSIQHQRMVMEISTQLATFLKNSKYEVFSSPIGLKLSNDQVLEPDIIVVEKKNAFTENYIVKSPTLIVEILSPSTEHRDLGVKKDLYEDFKVKEYWIIDPVLYTCTIYILKNSKFVKIKDIEIRNTKVTSISLDGFTLNEIP
ncbi:MAG: Uma2 family endonuclease [Candidatus Heimdallarchaeota archaeon]|nr:Uma2 family endonuclease [Candidatus Heimdallarchaeota archaeon]